MSHVRRARLAAALLAVAGGVVWNTTYSLQRSSRVKNAVTGAALGAAVGAYFGGRTVREVWQPAVLPRSPRPARR